MIINNKTIESGKEYTLSDLFSGKNKIIIPDLQRDYCWGDKAWDEDEAKYTELVSGFLDSLIEMYVKSRKDKLTLGLIYGYESPKNHIQLCDGQQRITTLFLLIGILNRFAENKFTKWLISEDELHHDDKEPYLQYSIRESTLYFLSDLVCEFFLKSEVTTKDIKSSKWYFSEYENDASIQSMLAALNTIEQKLPLEMDYIDFGDFIANNLQMIYYDMGDRKKGEETFVVINTTGEPLTATENLKPILIGNIKNENHRKKVSEEWEEREEWFWRNRSSNEQTADDSLKDFFIWYWQIRLLQERKWVKQKGYELNPKELFTREPEINSDNEENPEIERYEDSVKPESIHSYFCSLSKLVELCQDKGIKRVLNTIKEGEISLNWFRGLPKEKSLNVVLPLIAYCKKFVKPTLFYEFVRRIRKNYFDKELKYRDKNFVDWRYIVQIVELSENEADVLKFETLKNYDKFKKISNTELNEWYNQEEKWKSELKRINKIIVETWEDNPDFVGDLLPLLNITNQSIDIERINKYYLIYEQIDPSNFTYSEDIELKNLYRLSFLLNNKWFDHRAVAGLGYCMLCKSDNPRFLSKYFDIVWKTFTENKAMINIILKEHIEGHFNFLNNEDFKLDINSIEHYDLIKLWALLEFLFFRNSVEIEYYKEYRSIACFWNKSKVLINENIENKYQIGNLKLGLSWFNNKTGRLEYSFPLMKEINSREINIEEQTKKYWMEIKGFISNIGSNNA